MQNKVFLALGSNIGDSVANLNTALDLLEDKVNILNISSYYETEPIGYKDQDSFVNIVVEGRTDLCPEKLLDFTQSVEKEMKRIKTIVNGPRIIDVDILLYNDITYKDERLIIPHPRMLQRAFVVIPLQEISPDIIVEGIELRSLIAQLKNQGIQKLYIADERINCIINDKDFSFYLQKIESLEKERIFCHHNLNHFLDVARIAWILNLEEDLKLSKEVVYATGLLHDIGRWQEYQTGLDHAIASAELAESILDRCAFKVQEKTIILDAIRNHRKLDIINDLNRIIYKADKMSRPCFNCPSISHCKRFKNGEKPVLYY